ncbi:2-oxo acid dehydrogenase subunit E2 [Streptomyces sp. NBC_00076]|uniref:2-oxo acid dehydrogenase subunit E2 n=1 Tax=Streptomyces sp. NBC_00076 TaxID=2975642 RepID=UPI00324DF97F
MAADMTMARALNTALRDALDADDRVVVFGEDVGRLGGVFRVTDGLRDAFGDRRCFDTPVSEAGIAGLAVGMAMAGFRPVVEMQFDAFAYPAFEQIASHIAKMRNRTRGALPLPLVVRIPYGGGIGGVEHHSDSSEAYYAHTAGLKVVTPATAEDAYSLLREAIDDPDPVVFLEPKRHYWTRENVELPVRTAPFGTSAVRRAGRDVTLVAYGPSVAVALEAAQRAAAEGLDVEVLDLRTLVPLDDRTTAASVRRTGRCLVVHEAQGFAGVGAEIAARVQEECFDALRAPVLRVTGFDIPYPPPLLESAHLPGVQRVLAGLRRLVPSDAERPSRRVNLARSARAATGRTFRLPDLGEGLADAEVLEWKVAVGDSVEHDQAVVEVETAKSAVTLPSPYAGAVTALHCAEGEVVQVGAPLLTVTGADAGGEADSDAALSEREAESGAERTVGKDVPRAEPTIRNADADAELTVEKAESDAELTVEKADPGADPTLRNAASADPHTVTAAGSGAVLTGYGTNAAQRWSLAATNGVGGGARAGAGGGTTPAGDRRRPTGAVEAQTRVPLDASAEKFVRGHRDTPAVTIWADTDATGLLAARDRLGIGLLPLLARACLTGLAAFPELNARVDAERGEIVRPPGVHLGIAAQTMNGLVVPVVRDAGRLSPDDLTAELRRLTSLARRGTLPLEHRTGGTFTLNNYGVFGVDGATPILNHPQAAMLGVGRLLDRPWVVDGRLEVRKVVQLSLTFDHRVCDGGTAAGFLRHVVDGIAAPTG